MQFKNILEHFSNYVVDDFGDHAQCRCPVHNDSNPSLTLTYKPNDKRTVVYCHTGCNVNEILESVGLTVNDLKEDYIQDKKINNKNGFNNYYEVIQYLKDNPIGNDPIIKAYKFKDEKGNIRYIKTRTKNKTFQHVRLIDNSLIWGLKGGPYYETYDNSNIYSTKRRDTKEKNIEEESKILYNLPNVIKGIDEGKTIYIVEGEKDADNLIKHGLIATTTSTGGGKGSEKWNKRYSEHFKGADVVILPDNDESGKEFAECVERSILNYCYRVKVLTVSDQPKGDISDWLEEGHDIKDLYKLLNDIQPIYANWYKISKEGQCYGINTAILTHHLEHNMNYKMVSGGNKALFHLYVDGVYKIVKDLTPYIRPYIYIEFRSAKACKDIFDGLKQSIPCSLKEVYGSEKIINVKNGLYDIEKDILMPHTPSYVSSTQLNCEYEDNPYNGGKWDKYINDLSNGNEDEKLFLQEVAGVLLSNIAGWRLKSIIGLQGKGDAGKTPFFMILGNILGEDLVGACSLQELSSSGFLATAIYGKRLVFDDDLPSTPLGSVGTLKKMSGGGELRIQYKGIDGFNYRFNGLVCFCCNDLPYLGNDKGDHYYNRYKILPCNNVIAKDKQDKFLVDKIVKNESNYIFKYALEGLKRVIKNGYSFTEYNVINNKREEIKINQDSVKAYFHYNIEFTGNNKDFIKVKHLHDKYTLWSSEEGYKPCEKKAFQERVLNSFNMKMTKKGNSPTLHGIKIKELYEVEPEEDIQEIFEDKQEDRKEIDLFIDRYFKLEKGQGILKSALYATYKSHCKKHKDNIIDESTLTNILYSKYGIEVKEKNRKLYYVGITGKNI